MASYTTGAIMQGGGRIFFCAHNVSVLVLYDFVAVAHRRHGTEWVPFCLVFFAYFLEASVLLSIQLAKGCPLGAGVSEAPASVSIYLFMYTYIDDFYYMYTYSMFWQ